MIFFSFDPPCLVLFHLVKMGLVTFFYSAYSTYLQLKAPVESATVGSICMYSEKNSPSIQSNSLFGQVGVCLHSENLLSWLGIKHNTDTHTNAHIYTGNITLTPDARMQSGDRVASTAKHYHA